MKNIAVSLLLAGLLAGCRAAPADRTGRWLQAVRKRGKPGDWLVIAGSHGGDQVVRVSTLSGLTHAAILDTKSDEVIEAVSPVVRTQALATFIASARRVLLIRPHRWNQKRGLAAVARARTRLGAPYDFLGTIGLPSRKRFYCTELVVWAYGITVDRKGPHKVLHPRRMDRLGKVLLDTKESER